MHFDTNVVRFGIEPDPTTGAIMPPIYATSTYVQESPGVHKGFEYARTGNPTRATLERCLAALEGASGAVATSSGSAATALLFQAAAARGTIVASSSAYHGTLRQLAEYVPAIGGHVRHAPTEDLDAVRAVVDEVGDRLGLLFVETPANPLLGISDLAGLAELAAAHGAPLACDSTFATPLNLRPLEYGIDLVADPEAGAYDAILIAVGHRQFADLGAVGIRRFGKPSSLVYDIKYVLPQGAADDRL